jgi:copper chaperone NosL
LACGGEPATSAGSSAAGESLDDQECAVCGMLVRDQPAPRARIVHRDGTEVFTCSLGDLLVHLSVPSPHGHAATVRVEVLAPDEDPADRDRGAHAWVDADDASYVVGVERRGIMGPPVLAYAKRVDAERAASGHDGAHVFDRAGLEAWWKAMHR